MKNKFIANYVNKITRDDIKYFAYNNGINLNDDELSYVYNEVKKNWMNLLYSDPEVIIDKINNNILTNKEKVIALYKEYYKKYKSYL